MKKTNSKRFSSLFREKGFYLSAICLIMVLVAVSYFSRLSAKEEQKEQTAQNDSKEESRIILPSDSALPKIDLAAEKKADANTASSKKTAETKMQAKSSTATADSVKKESDNSDKTLSVSNSNDKKVGQSAASFSKSSLSYPVVGNILTEYSGDKLIYSNTLDEWCYHGGIDIETELNGQVKSVADGVVDKIYTDNDLGKVIVINHKNGFKTLYANLLDKDIVKVGQEVKQGEIIGGIGKTATSEVGEAAHLHFEMLYNDVSVNPTEYLKAPNVTNY